MSCSPDLDAVETVRSGLVTALGTILPQLIAYNRGNCATSPATLCDSLTDCTAVSGGACLWVGLRRCAAAPAVPCTTSANCGASDVCLGDATTLSALSASLDYAGGHRPDVGAALTATTNTFTALAGESVPVLEPHSLGAPTLL